MQSKRRSAYRIEFLESRTLLLTVPAPRWSRRSWPCRSPEWRRFSPALADVPTTWDKTRVLLAEVGRCLVIARRKGDAWYLGGMTAAEGRELDLPLGFFGDGSFAAKLYLNHPGVVHPGFCNFGSA